MQVWKKAFSLLLAFALLLSCCPAITLTASAADASYVKVTSADQFTTGQYVMIVSTGYAPGVFSSGWITAVKPTVSDNTVTNPAGGVWTLTVDGTSVKITDANGVSIKPKSGNNNGIQSGTYSWAWAFANGTFTFAGVGSDTTKLASYNDGSNGNKFRSVKNSTISSQGTKYPCAFTLYKLTEVTGEEPEPEETEPVVTEPVETEPVETEAPTEPSVPEIEPTEAPTVPSEPSEPSTGPVTMDLSTHGNRTYFDSSEKVIYEQNGVIFTNLKGESKTALRDCKNEGDTHLRIYANSTVRIEYPGITKVEFTCTTASYAEVVKTSANSIGTVTVSGSVATLVLSAPVNTVEFAVTAQTRFSKVVVYAGETGEPPVTEPTEPPVVEPDDGTLLTIPQAIEMGAAKEHDTYTNNKFKVSGVITEVYNTTYGNMKITDEAGNILTIYGTYSADGKIRYDAMEVKPQVGDTVTLYGIIGQYNDDPQMKNGWIVEYKPMPTATVVLTPSKTEVKRGEEFTVTVSVTQAETYSSLGFDPTFEATGFAVVNTVVAEEAARKATMSGFDAEKGYNGVLMLSAAEAFTGDIFVYTLQAKEDMSLGAAVLTGTATANNNTQPLKITLTNAEVTIVCAHETLVDFESVDNETHTYTCDDCGETFTAAHGYDDEGFCESCGWYKQYTIVYKNWDGTVLAELTGIYYDWLEYEGETPVKPADETYTYAFRGWTPEVDIVTGDAEYTAVFEPVYIDYTVTFKDHDGTVLATGTYHYGDTVTAPTPADWHDEKQVYTFSGWDAEIATVTGNAEYTACYEVNGLRGDFTGDGKISDRDALHLLRYKLFGEETYPLNQSGDTNGDGNVTDADVVYLLRHVLFPNRYTLH